SDGRTLPRRRPPRAVNVEGHSDQDPLGLVGREALRQPFEVWSSAPPLYHPDPLCREAELVTHGDPDARLAHVERSDAHESRLSRAPARTQAKPPGTPPGCESKHERLTSNTAFGTGAAVKNFLSAGRVAGDVPVGRDR